MANILLLDDSEVAGRAMQGILARGNHACIHALAPDEAWRLLREGVVFDLVIVEVKTGGTAGMQFLQRLRDDWFWKVLPVVTYTSETDTRQVKKALGLRVQNYLIKPYTDELIYAEIAKALNNPWRHLHFEEAKSFCAMMGCTADALAKMRRELVAAFDRAARTYPAWADARQNEEVFAQLTALASDAEAAGVWAGVDYLRDLKEQAALGNWSAFKHAHEYLDYASRLIFCHLNPSHAPDCLRTPAQVDEAREAAERARWQDADVDANGPALDPGALEKEALALPGCPVIDTAAAAFQMVADGRAAGMNPVMDLVAADPGLCVQVLAAANNIDHDEMNAIEDPRSAVTLLGGVKLQALAKALPQAPERHLQAPPLTWANYLAFQRGVAQVAEFTCQYLEFSYLASPAQTAALIHDFGKLLLLKLHPCALPAIVRYAREKKVHVRDAERKHLGCTTRELAVKFAEMHKMPPAYIAVLRWIDAPDDATEHTELVAMVSLARHVCLVNHVGVSIEGLIEPGLSLGSTAAWRVLQPRLFPSFDLKKFESQAHAFCLTLRHQLSGHTRANALVA